MKAWKNLLVSIHSPCHSISIYYPSPISSSAASDILQIMYLFTLWRSLEGEIWMDIWMIRWIIISIVSTLKQNHRKFCTFLQTVKMQFNMGKTRNESIYSATWLSICFSMLALSLPYNQFIRLSASIGRLTINSLHGGIC